MTRWLSWGLSVAGPGHIECAAPGQDTWMSRHYQWGDVVAVSDGVGTCEHAIDGAHAACRAVAEAVELCQRHGVLETPDLPRLIQGIWRALVFPLQPSQCSATCLFAMRAHGGVARMGLLGDGLAAACRTDGGVDILTADKSDSFANITVGLASADPARDWRQLAAPESRFDAFVLCTDGIADDLAPDRAAAFAREAYVHYQGFPEQDVAADLRRWMEAWPVPGHADDKSIACLYRGEAPRG